MSHAQLGRIERVELRSLSIEQAALACSVLGLRFVARSYPRGNPLVDHAHVALLERFRAAIPAGIGLLTEVPIGLRGDLRAWDAMIVVAGHRIGIEVETRLRDLQALERRIALKQRDSGIERVILVASASVANRDVLKAHRERLAGRFPLTARQVVRDLQAGVVPRGDALVLL